MEQAGECLKTTNTNGMLSLLSIDQLPGEDVYLMVWRKELEKTDEF